MTNSDLSKLKLDKSGAGFRRKRKIPRRGLIVVGAVVVSAVVFLFAADPSVEVETAVVSRTFPSHGGASIIGRQVRPESSLTKILLPLAKYTRFESFASKTGTTQVFPQTMRISSILQVLPRSAER